MNVACRKWGELLSCGLDLGRVKGVIADIQNLSRNCNDSRNTAIIAETIISFSEKGIGRWGNNVALKL